MVIRISQAILIASGALTGLGLVYAINRFTHNSDNTTATTSATATTPRNNRPRRARHIRRRRNRVDEPSTNENAMDIDDDARGGASAYKEWSEDDNKNLINLLCAISENQSRKEGFIHRGITCNKCSVSPIRGIRYKCANCVDFDLCESCEGTNTHINTHVFLKIRIPIPPLANPRSALLPPFYPGRHSNTQPLPIDRYHQLQNTSHFDIVELEALYEQFKSLSTVDRPEGGIDRETFEQCLGPLGLEKNLITERIFAFFDQDRDSVISFPEIVAGLSVLCKGNLDEKIEYAFKGYDLDEDGYISRDELYRMYKSYFYLSMELVRDVVSAMEDEMMDTFEFSASQPVSAAFNVAMPATPLDRASSDDEDDDNGEEETEEAGPSQQQPSLNTTTTATNNTNMNTTTTTKSKKKRYPLKEDHFLKQYTREAEQAKALAEASEAQLNSMADDVMRSDSQRLFMTREYDQEDHAMQKRKQDLDSIPGKKVWEEKFPIMETMSQGAINEMVDKTFKSIETERQGYINFKEFKQCVHIDSSIVSWFEALGTVF
ncbi:EF-hand [Backusella circina FSU 941]|nr:EF-hand [Backusella circina FSU 941]